MTTTIEPRTLACGPITRTTLALFAGASGDHNPIHIDLDVALAAGMDDVFAHGMLSMAYLARLVTEVAPQAELRALTARFVAITPVHAKPTCTAAVTSVEDGVTTLALSVALEDGTVTLTGTATLAPA